MKSDTMYARVLDAKASSLYGRCTEEGQMEKVDVRFVECSVGTWKEIDSLHYYLGNCSYDNKKGVHLGVYYGCISEDDPWGHYWNEITPPDYYDSTCIGSKDHKVLKFDDEYYICETDICRGSDGFSASDCYENGTWRKLKDEELIPPVVDLEWCTKTVENKKLAYDGVFQFALAIRCVGLQPQKFQCNRIFDDVLRLLYSLTFARKTHHLIFITA